MPFRKRAVRRRRPFKRTRTYRRRRIMRPGRSLMVHSFKRKVNYGSFDFDSGTNGYKSGALTFRLSDVPGYAEFGPMYDKFRIDYVKLYFCCRYNTNSYAETASATYQVGSIHGLVVVDTDDETPVTQDESGMNDMRQHPRAKSHIFGNGKSQILSMGCKPRILSEVYRSGIATSYNPIRAPFLSYGSNGFSIPHYGVKFCFRLPTTGSALNPFKVPMDVFATFYLSMRDPK
ncbi:putative capsid protein [Dragonfly larvae associated circular virus-6]|uniref:putative capsid protein n=1 Tax=Dragonfly larvae associated circular virus-6 TaxID=1454027 RepID=UPI0003E81BFB|nr:putative capsid protein [Dragonfly larvae associated circular virus-6]AHH31474.1 putative capsid protein [Dragonfly larvae associated circular virus-6]ALE29848.1 coat protein [Dragonfly larvae associated circular virus-6]